MAWCWTGSLICAWINGWVNNCEAGDLRRYIAHYDVIVMTFSPSASEATLKDMGKYMIWIHFICLLKQDKSNEPILWVRL